MSRYEILFLTVPEITQDEISSIESQVQKLVREHSGSFVSFERWGKMLLAYPIRHHDYGVYFLFRFEVAEASAEALIEALKTYLAVKLNETVMRHLINRLDMKASLMYQRPDSLEEMPGRTTDALMKEHRIGASSAPRAQNSMDQEFEIEGK
jgi:small subunit ribosomal protein S6